MVLLAHEVGNVLIIRIELKSIPTYRLVKKKNEKYSYVGTNSVNAIVIAFFTSIVCTNSY